MSWVKRMPLGDPAYFCDCRPCPFCFTWVDEKADAANRRTNLNLVLPVLAGTAFLLTLGVTMRHHTTWTTALATRPIPLASGPSAPRLASDPPATSFSNPAAGQQPAVPSVPASGVIAPEAGPKTVSSAIIELLNNQAQPALNHLAALLDGLVRSQGQALARNPRFFKSRVALATRELANVQTALEKIRLDNQQFQRELHEIIGPTTQLARLSSQLQSFNDSLASLDDIPEQKPAEIVARLIESAEQLQQQAGSARTSAEESVARLASARDEQRSPIRQ